MLHLEVGRTIRPPNCRSNPMKLYHFPLSGHAHRARLFLSLIGATAEIEDVDLGAGAHKQPDFLALNRFGQVPVLVDGDAVIADSNAILVYLAKTFGRSDWLPEGPATAAEVIARAHAVLGVIESELTGRTWIAGTAQPTIADVALYSYIASAPEGNVDLSGYQHVRGWLSRIEALPSFVPFPKTPAGLTAAT
jgi:glutathione S-transferase